MPLVRFEVRNEYGLSDPELYCRPCGPGEDPKPAFDGLGVAGLVGILRQLGDLAEFASDVFCDLNEQVINLGARAQKLSSQMQRIESALPSLENAVQNQRSHIHFAYVTGCDWHANIRTVQSQLICSDLPQFMLDSYEECCDPPRLYLLDKFDSAGAGACLRRYSDPSYFRRAMTSSLPVKSDKIKKKRKKKRSRLRSRDIHEVFTPRESISTQFASPGTESMTDTRSKSEAERESTYSDPDTKVNFQILDTHSVVYNEIECNRSSASTSNISHVDALGYVQNEPIEDTADADSQHGSLQEQSVSSSRSVTWDEKVEIVYPAGPETCDGALLDKDQVTESFSLKFEPLKLDSENGKVEKSSQEYIEFDIGRIPGSSSSVNLINEVSSETEYYMDTTNILTPDPDKDAKFLDQWDSELTEQEEKAVSRSEFINAEVFETETGAEFLNKHEEKSPSNSTYADAEKESRGLEERAMSSLRRIDVQASEIETDGDFLDNEELKSSSNISFANSKSVFNEVDERAISDSDYVDAQDSAMTTELLSKRDWKSSSTLTYPDSKSESSELKMMAVSCLDVADAQASDIEMDGEFLKTQELKTLSNFSYAQPKSVLIELEERAVCTLECNGAHVSATETDGELVINQGLKCLLNFGGADSDSNLNEIEKIAASSLDVNDSQASEIEPNCEFVSKQESKTLSYSRLSELEESAVSTLDCIDAQASETDTDGELPNKQELQSLSDFSYTDTKSEFSELKEKALSSLDCTDAQSSSRSCSFETDYIPPRLSNGVTSEDIAHIDQLICSTDHVSKLDPLSKNLSKNDCFGCPISNVSGINGSEFFLADVSSESTFVSEMTELVEDTKVQHQNTHVSVQVPLFSCWTNGGILGLEPSKPPDFSILNERPVANLQTVAQGTSLLLSHDMPMKQNSTQSLRDPSSAEHERTRDVSAKRTFTTAPGPDLPGSANIELQSNGFEHSISTSISGLAQRFLANSLQKRILVNHVEDPTPPKLANGDFRVSHELSLQKKYHAVENGFVSHALDKENAEVVPPDKSLFTGSPKRGSSSPPLDHMNISFHPMNLQTSKLKLDFSSGNLNDSNGNEIFHSFQLIPEASFVLSGTTSESDDDTFCRSSYSSHDVLSPHSDSTSELWGEDEKSESQEYNFSSNAHGSSSMTTSFCSSFEIDEMGRCKTENFEKGSGIGDFDFSPLGDLPGIDSLIVPEKQQDEKSDSFSAGPVDSKLSSSVEVQPSLLPPCPPVHWQVLKSSSSSDEENCTEAEVFNHLDAYAPNSVMLHNKEQYSLRSHCDAEIVVDSSKITENMNGHCELNHTVNCKESNEIEDLLQQTRTQDVNLRCTIITQPSEKPASANFDNITATPDKADVICQAFDSSKKGENEDNRSKD